MVEKKIFWKLIAVPLWLTQKSNKIWPPFTLEIFKKPSLFPFTIFWGAENEMLWRSQFHQHYTYEFFVRTLFSLVTFWLCQKNLYKKFASLTLMKLTAGAEVVDPIGKCNLKDVKPVINFWIVCASTEEKKEEKNLDWYLTNFRTAAYN